MTRSRDTSNIFDPNSDIVNSSELNIAINTASAAAVAYTDSELGTIDLSSAIQTASAAAVAYTDAELASIDLSSTIQTASAAAASYTDAEINIIEASLIGTINTASGAVVTYLVDSAPATLDTLNELSAALNDDPNFYSTIQAVYLSQSNASTTYLTQSSASSTYLTQSSASTQYEKNIPYSSSTPSSPVSGDMWVDSSLTPPSLKVYTGSEWVQLGAAVDDSQAIIASRMFA